jgi:hypothetical protein
MNAGAITETQETSLRKFFLAALLWLPLAFFLWFALRSVVVYLPIRAAVAWLVAWMPELVKGGRQDMFEMALDTVARLDGIAGLPSNKIAVPVAINALAYCYGLPILVGLVMATPLTWTRTFVQCAIGYAVILPCQVFGLVGDSLKHLYFDFGSLVASGIADAGFPQLAQAAGVAAANGADAVLSAHGIGATGAGLWYQFGTLIMPTIVPVVAWILLNRVFIEAITGRRWAEPVAASGGPPPA